MNALGLRIRDARLRLKMTQAQLAYYCGVSRAAVAQWESGTTQPTLDRLRKAAHALHLDPAELVVTAPVSWTPKDSYTPPGFHWAPLIDFSRAAGLEVPTETDGPPVRFGEAKGYLGTSLPISDQAFALTVRDPSMTPDFREGDTVIVDPAVKPDPGDIVIAHMLHEFEAVLRKYRPRGTDPHGRPQFELIPLNPDWPAVTTDASMLGRLIGTVVEHRRFLRTRDSA